MAAGMRITVIGGEKLNAALLASEVKVRESMQKAIGRSLIIVYRKVAENLTGRVLKVQTGRLRQSVQTYQDTEALKGTIGSNVEYAAIHEYGGQTRPHTITPRGRALRFIDPGFIGPVKLTAKGKIARRSRSGVVFAAKVNHPGSTIPARPWLRPALTDSQEEIRAIFRAGLAGAK